MRDLEGAQVLLAVGQKPFETPSAAGGTFNLFGTLIPVMFEDGTPAPREQFPDNGDVWWMVRPSSKPFAEPGRLVVGVLEESPHAGEPGKARFQVKVDSIEPVRPRQFVEILDVPVNAVSEPRQLVSRGPLISIDHPSADHVYARWKGHLYGLLRAESEPESDLPARHRVRFSTIGQDSTVRQIPDNILQKMNLDGCRVEVEVSLDNDPLARTRRRQRCTYFLLPSAKFEALVPHDAPQLVLESDRLIIGRVARRLFNRSKRQELNRLLQELEESLSADAEAAQRDETEVLRLLQNKSKEQDAGAAKLADSLLDSGLLAVEVAEAQRRRANEYVSEHAARLQTEIDNKVSEVRQQLASLQSQKEQLGEQLAAQRQKALVQLQNELDQKNRALEQEWQSKQEQLEEQRRELDHQRQMVSELLVEVSGKLSVNRDETVRDFLAMLPLLTQLGLVSGSGSSSGAEPSRPEAETRPPGEGRGATDEPFRLPDFVHHHDDGGGQVVSEAAFFQRFCQHVANSGFRYRKIELISFHLSVKCGDITILGGLPGTGKSSLPRLYMQALMGDDGADGLPRYLHVGVSPSWLDMRDLLGHVNTLDRCFQPTESGLYQHLICAQEEDAQRGAASGLYLVCLDEMNLAHVEHYFSGFIQALEREDGMREVRCFAPEVVSAGSTFARWPVLKLPRSLRFVGTVNFDETTRQLSQRLLDRANLIRLSGDLPLQLSEPARARCGGPPIDTRTYRSWISRTGDLYRPLAELIDNLQKHFTVLGCQINPRRFNAIRTFIASAPPEICSWEQAFDLQIAQRLLPQIRGLFRPGAQEALEGVARVLESHPQEFPESRRILGEVRRSEYPSITFGEELP